MTSRVTAAAPPRRTGSRTPGRSRRRRGSGARCTAAAAGPRRGRTGSRRRRRSVRSWPAGPGRRPRAPGRRGSPAAGSWSWQPQLVGVADGVDGHDPPVVDREAHDGGHAAVDRQHARHAVDVDDRQLAGVLGQRADRAAPPDRRRRSACAPRSRGRRRRWSGRRPGAAARPGARCRPPARPGRRPRSTSRCCSRVAGKRGRRASTATAGARSLLARGLRCRVEHLRDLLNA